MRYQVTVKQTLLEYWNVEANSAEEAAENWQDGKLTSTDDTYLESEVIDTEPEED